ncbi:hypothetical protein [Novosphingobium humi]|uniref:Uncharacterized protein n=1 Tax=Novosphingobium humi TaxID=2282397 RepID=A0ABY7TZH1_9SPHN|nr:hypothetical protein [Novosphingobium humi]WCT78667.1 hypothetical protein PQ457_06805 [Novosphingobium humi]
MPWPAPDDIVTSQLLLGLFETQLRADGATDAGARVFQPADWPTVRGQMPIIKLRILRERRQSQGRSGPPQYTTTALIRVIGEVEAYASEDNAGAAAAEAACWLLKRQIEVAIVNSHDLFMRIQQIASIDSGLVISAEGATHIAAIVMDFVIEFFEDADSFAPIAADDMAEVDLTAANHPPLSAQFPLNP